MFGMLEKLTKAIKINIEIPVPDAKGEAAPEESPCIRKIKLKKKASKSKDDTAESKEDSIDGVELGDTMMRHMLPDMNSKREKK